MSVVGQWPYAFIKQWIQPISYMTGMTYDGRMINAVSQYFSADFLGGRITATAWFSYPVVAIYGFTTLTISGITYTTDPIVIIPDYPVMGIFLSISITP